MSGIKWHINWSLKTSMSKLTPKIILVNGPPRAGKDTAQEAVANSVRCKFALAVKEGAHAAFGLDPREYPMDVFEAVKDEPNTLFFGKSPREAYIAYSEMFMKPFTGDKQVFGKLLIRWIENILEVWDKDDLPNLPFIVTDSGFRPEAMALVEAFGAENIKLIRVHREGCNFDNDSRSYIHLADLGVEEEDVHNDDIGDYKREIALIVEEFTNG